MIPLLIISSDKKQVEKYISKLKEGCLFFEILPTTKEYSIDDIKSLIKETKIFNPQTRIYFLDNFNLSSIPAQNSFLKLLEEPPSNVQFVLKVENNNSLLPTIISRTKIVKLQMSTQETDKSFLFANKFIGDLIDRPSLKIPFVQFKISDSDAASKVLLEIIVYFQKRLETDKKAPLVIKKIMYLYKLLKSNNLNSQLAIDETLIFIWKTYTIK